MKLLPATFLLLSAVAKADDTMPALAPAYSELPPTFWKQHEAAIIIAIFAMLAFVFLFLKVMFRPESAVTLPPEVLARSVLTKLQLQAEDGKVLSEVSQALRRYVAAVLQFPAGELTTAEFSAALAGNDTMGAELAQMVSVFLRECDERKFSPASAVTPLNAATCALALLEQIETRRAASAAQTTAVK
jgi:hypothetical protein